MKILTFTFVAVIATTIIGFRLFGINPTYKAARVTSTVTQGANTNNTPHQEEDLKLHQDIRILPDGAAPALNDDHQQYHSTTNRKLDSSCDDSPLKVLTGKARKSAKTCKIIASKPKRFCKGRIIKSHCPDACGVCESFGNADSEATFLFDGGKTDCAWLHDLVTPSTLLQISMLCKVDAIRETCRHTCSFFFHSCAMCSSEPTSRPSLEVMSYAPSPSPTIQCPDKITSIIDEHFGDITKGPPQEEAYTWLIKDITDDECDNEAMIVQRYILAVLYLSTRGDHWERNGGWLGSATECNWSEVYCNDNQQVLDLGLWSSNLNGTIPSELSSLTNLEELYLSGNNLSGLIPGSIFQLPKLQYLALDENDLTGTIPYNFGGSTSLRYIFLSDNLLTGTIPEITGDSLQSIEGLSLEQNKMSRPVPDSICDLRSSKPYEFIELRADCAPPDNAQNPCPSGCCTRCSVGKGLP